MRDETVTTRRTEEAERGVLTVIARRLTVAICPASGHHLECQCLDRAHAADSPIGCPNEVEVEMVPAERLRRAIDLLRELADEAAKAVCEPARFDQRKLSSVVARARRHLGER